jgi:nucleotide sugar dehydrogenase
MRKLVTDIGEHRTKRLNAGHSYAEDTPAMRLGTVPHPGRLREPGGKLVVVGQGYVGLPLAMAGVAAGFDVVGVDVDERRVKRLNAGDSYIEDVPAAQLAAALRTGRFLASGSLADAEGFDVCVIAVPTPLCDGAPDTAHIEDAARGVAGHMRAGCMVVLESTTYPGTTEELVRPVLEAGSGLRAPRDFALGYSPERIDPGNRRWRLENTPKIVSGIDAASLARVADFYDRLVQRTVPVPDIRTAELAKLLENMFRHVNVALVNELATAAGDLGVDVWEALRAAATKPFGYLPFLPGPGVGGHCLPTDPTYLSWHLLRSGGRRLRFVDLANEVNGAMPGYVVSRLMAGLNARRLPVAGSRILLLGLSYKRDVGDLRESPALEVARRLCRLGARVRAVEPLVPVERVDPELCLVGLTEEEVAASDAVVVLADHTVFDYRMVEQTASYVFDTRDRCRGQNVERL